MRIIRMPKFERTAAKIFAPAEIEALEDWLVEHPTCGDVIRGAGGCRKMRWAAKGKGKRGGARVIYYLRLSASQIMLLRAYAKNEKTDLEPSEIKQLKKETGEFSHE